MPNFKVKMKLEGFELEIEGEREDASLISEQIGQQFAGMLSPVSGIIEPNAYPRVQELQVTPSPAPTRQRKRRKTAAASGETSSSNAVEFRHDIEKFGSPSQSWNPTKKSIWLLYVLKESVTINEASAGTIATTFNQHFKSAGTIRGSNVSRDLGKIKTNEKPSPVGEDTTKDPSTWYLTDAGVAMAQVLVREATSSPSLDV